jgi:AcrR family transcriptional regulator
MNGVVEQPTRRRILEAAREVLSADPAAGLGEVAKAAAVSRATVHRHFRTRAELMAEAGLEPDEDTRSRVLAAAAELLAVRGLADLSMDDVAAAAGVSRAGTYRLFPGKSALVEALVTAYSAFTPAEDLLARSMDRPPEEVLPELYRLAGPIVASNVGVLRAIILETTSGSAEAMAGVQRPLAGLLSLVYAYLGRQMELGRMPAMDPGLAVQALLGPLIFHLLTRPVTSRLLGIEAPFEQVVEQLGEIAMRGLLAGPVAPEGSAQ